MLKNIGPTISNRLDNGEIREVVLSETDHQGDHVSSIHVQEDPP